MLTPALRLRKLPPLALLSVLLLFVLSADAQQKAVADENTPAKTPGLPAAYDVVSIKPHAANESDTYHGWRYTPSGIVGSDISVRSLMMTAYHLIMPGQISGLPAWADTETFDIEAKLDPADAEALGKLSTEERDAQNTRMLRALLADRFKLQTSQSRKDLPVYNLVIAKSGPKLKKATSSDASGYNITVGSLCTLKSESIDASGLAEGLSNMAGRVIIDRTELKGRYEVALQWAFNENFANAGPSLFTALQEQLGLKLEPAKAPLDVIVIDHIERPSEN